MMTGGGYIGLSEFRSGWEQGIAQFLMTILFTWLFYWFYLAISPSLVDAAIGAKEGVFGALKRTKGHGKICRSLSVIITGCTGVTSFIGIGTLGFPLLMVLAINLVVYWLAFMISISILTVIYRINDEAQTKTAEAAEGTSPAG